MSVKRRFSMEKLGRDKLEDFFSKQEAVARVRTLSRDELITALKYKLLEESQEVFSSTDHINLMEELADVKEVILSLMHLCDISETMVEEQRLIKKDSLGGFRQGKYFHYVDIPEHCPDLPYFLERPEKYPEIEFNEEA